MTNIQDIIVNRHPEKSKYTSIKRENLWNSYYDHAQQFKEIWLSLLYSELKSM